MDTTSRAKSKFAMDLQGDGMNMLSIYANNYSISVATPNALERFADHQRPTPANGF